MNARRSALVLSLALAVASLTVVSAQRGLRRVFVAVDHVSGAPVTDLEAPDFRLLENGIERRVARARISSEPMRIVLLVDASTTVSPLIRDFRNGLLAFLDALPTEHEVAFVSVSGQLRVRLPPTLDRERLRTAIANFSSDGGANVLMDALLESDRRFLREPRDRWPVFVIVTTDATTTRGEPPVDEFNAMVTSFQGRGGSAHALVIRGTNAGGLATEVAQNIAANTGGIFQQMALSTALPDYLRTIATRLRTDHAAMQNRYLVEYESGFSSGPPAVEVSVARNDVRVRVSAKRPF